MQNTSSVVRKMLFHPTLVQDVICTVLSDHCMYTIYYIRISKVSKMYCFRGESRGWTDLGSSHKSPDLSNMRCVALLLGFVHCLKQLNIHVTEADKLNLTQSTGQFP